MIVASGNHAQQTWVERETDRSPDHFMHRVGSDQTSTRLSRKQHNGNQVRPTIVLNSEYEGASAIPKWSISSDMFVIQEYITVIWAMCHTRPHRHRITASRGPYMGNLGDRFQAKYMGRVFESVVFTICLSAVSPRKLYRSDRRVISAAV